MRHKTSFPNLDITKSPANWGREYPYLRSLARRCRPASIECRYDSLHRQNISVLVAKREQTDIAPVVPCSVRIGSAYFRTPAKPSSNQKLNSGEAMMPLLSLSNPS